MPPEEPRMFLSEEQRRLAGEIAEAYGSRT
jgi:hypothetical protein